MAIAGKESFLDYPKFLYWFNLLKCANPYPEGDREEKFFFRKSIDKDRGIGYIGKCAVESESEATRPEPRQLKSLKEL
ncbi:MAG: hypothetical protein AB4041_08835, partial [Microcystaceae cyanobacterium]